VAENINQLDPAKVRDALEAMRKMHAAGSEMDFSIVGSQRAVQQSRELMARVNEQLTAGQCGRLVLK
jgi:hypothetical protein